MKLTRLFIFLGLALCLTPLAALAADPPSLTGQIGDAFLEAALPVIGTVLAGAVTWAVVEFKKLIGAQRAEVLLNAIKQGLDNGILATGGTASTPAIIAAEAVAHVKAGFPDAIRALGAKDGALMTLAKARLTQLVLNGFQPPAPKT